MSTLAIPAQPTTREPLVSLDGLVKHYPAGKGKKVVSRKGKRR